MSYACTESVRISSRLQSVYSKRQATKAMATIANTKEHDQMLHEVNGNGNGVYDNASESASRPETKVENGSKPPKSAIPTGFNPADFPDGGATAWAVVAGAWCCLFCSWGWVTSIGVFQNYYQENQLKQYSPSEIGWIPSLEAFMMFVGGIPFGKIFDSYGPRYLLLGGTLVHIFGVMMISICKKYYQFLLAQGICSALGASAIFYAANNSVSTWFLKRRALAIGVAFSGASMGGVIIPNLGHFRAYFDLDSIMVNQLIPIVGFGWAIRATAFMMLGLMIIGNTTVKSRITPQPRPFNIQEFIDPLTDMPFSCTSLATFFFMFGTFLPFDFIPSQAEHEGMSPYLAGYLLSILNAVSIFGRIIPGYAGDKLGRFNVMLAVTTASTIIVLALWLPSRGNTPTILFSAFYGFTSGTFVSLVPALIAQISDIRKIGVRIGVNYLIVSVSGLIQNPIGGALISRNNGGYEYLQIFCGLTMAVGTMLYLVARILQVGFKVAKV
ncbi:monocarboxylate permease protein [Rutstroemia sp. NJR-2017a WRK4]|nr:monocarboxylate permease protein [Rutstroemia sp. NJR-2017a WRK4]